MTETQQNAWLAPSDSKRQLWGREQEPQPGLSPPSAACYLAQDRGPKGRIAGV